MKKIAFSICYLFCFNFSISQIKTFIGETKSQVKEFWATEVSSLYFHDEVESMFYIAFENVGIPEFTAYFDEKDKCTSHSSKLTFSDISVIQARLKKAGFMYNSVKENWLHPVKKIMVEINQYGNSFVISFETTNKEYLIKKEKAALARQKKLKEEEDKLAAEKRIEYEKKENEIDSLANFSKVEVELKLLQEKGLRNKAEAEEVFAITEYMPEPIGGNPAFRQYVKENLRKPKVVLEDGISGKAFIKFIVEIDGSLTNFIVLKGVPSCKSCDEEAIRIIQSYPQGWKAGKQNGKNVRVYYTLPISFIRDN